MRVLKVLFLFFVAKKDVTYSPGCFTGIVLGCSINEFRSPGRANNVIGIAARNCSVGKNSDELASQCKSGNVGKETRHSHYVSFSRG